MLCTLVARSDKRYYVAAIPSYAAYLHCGIAASNGFLLIGSKLCKKLTEVAGLIIIIEFSWCDGCVRQIWISGIPELKRICYCGRLWYWISPIMIHFSAEIESCYSWA